jgi:hypothetical protein
MNWMWLHGAMRRLVAFVALCAPLCQAETPPSLASDAAAVGAWLAPQPAGLAPPCSDRAAWGSDTVRARTAAIVADAPRLAEQPMPAWDDDAYLDYSRSGQRPRGERMMNARKAQLYPLVLAECVQWQGRYVAAIERALLALSQQPTWTWPAHDVNLRNFRDHQYDVDLMAADTANEIAQTLHLMGERIGSAPRSAALAALHERIFEPVRRSLASGNGNRWLEATHNWNAVCLGGVVPAALAVVDAREDRALFIAAARRHILRYVEGFDADGYTPEGPGYWNYGFSHYVVLREALRAATGGRVDLWGGEQAVKARAMAAYGARIEMAPGNIAAFGDARLGTRLDAATVAYLEEVFAFGRSERLRSVALPPTRSPGNMSALSVAALLLFAQPRAAASPDAPRLDALRSWFAQSGVLVSRAGAGNGLAVTIKAGGNGNHSHDDIGSYTIGLGTAQPVGDPGATQYTSKTFSRERYTLRAINSWGHPVPRIGGQLQRRATSVRAPVLATTFTPALDAVTIDLAPAYDLSPGDRLTRELRHEREEAGRVTVEDRFRFARAQAFETALVTTGRWKEVAADVIEFDSAGRAVRARVVASAPFALQAERVDEEGLAFTRVAVALREPQAAGFVRIEFEPVTALTKP